MVVETLFVGRNNTFSLQLLRADVAISLMSIIGYELYLSNGRVFSDVDNLESDSRFKEKDNGIVEISIGDLLTSADVGTHTAHLVTYDPVNSAGVRWPNFKIKVKA